MSRLTPSVALALSVVLVVSLGAGASLVGLVQAVPDARLTITDATVSPAQPVVGAPTTVEATVSLSGGSASPVSLTQVALVDGDETLAVARDLGALSQGGTLTVPLTTTFEEAGQRDLQLVVVAENASGEEVRATRPLTIVVEDAAPLVTVRPGAPDTAVAGTATQVAVEVANPTTEPIRNVVVDVQVGDVAGRATLASLAGGATQTLNVTVVPASTGDLPVDADVQYTTAVGTRATTTASGTLAVSDLREDVGVRVERVSQTQQGGGGSLEEQLGSLVGGNPAAGGGPTQQGSGGDADSSSTVAVTVTNFGNAPLRDVVVQSRVEGTALDRYAVGTLAPGASESVTVDLSRAPAGTITFETTYALAGTTGTETASYDHRPVTGAIRVTGVNLSVGGDGRLRIEGNAGNTGEATVSGVVVSVGESEFVRPAYPQRDYFVGSVDGSEFAPFELTADVDLANASSVPVDVTYVVDGIERTERIDLPLDGVEAPAEGGTGLPLGQLGALAVVLFAAAAVVVAVRFR